MFKIKAIRTTDEAQSLASAKTAEKIARATLLCHLQLQLVKDYRICVKKHGAAPFTVEGVMASYRKLSFSDLLAIQKRIN